MSREEYNTCMRPYIAGSRPKEERKRSFCIGAKICSGKAKNEEEAAQICAEADANPKPQKEKKGKKVCTLKDLDAISVCLAQNIDLNELSHENMQNVFSNALKKCSGVKLTKRITSAKTVLEQMDPQQIKALETIALLSQQSEGRKW